MVKMIIGILFLFFASILTIYIRSIYRRDSRRGLVAILCTVLLTTFGGLMVNSEWNNLQTEPINNSKPTVLSVENSPDAIVQQSVNSPNSIQVGGNLTVNDNARVLSYETIEAMQPAFAALPNLEVEIIVSIGDGESYELGNQLNGIFENVGWIVSDVSPVIADPPIGRGIKVYFWEKPSGALQAVFSPIFTQFDYEKVASVDKTLPDKLIRMYVGAK